MRTSRARQVSSLEELWKSRPDAALDDLDASAEERGSQVAPVALRYEDAAEYQVRGGTHILTQAFAHARAHALCTRTSARTHARLPPHKLSALPSR